MHVFTDTTLTGLQPKTRNRDEIDARYKWNLNDIYPNWDAWKADFKTIRAMMDEFVTLEGKLGESADTLVKAFELSDKIGMLSYKLYRYPQLTFDTDQRDNAVDSKLQEVQILFAEYGTRTAWFTPEVLSIDEATVTGWINSTPALEPYRFPIAEIYRSQKHVLDAKGEQLLSLSSRFRSAPAEVYQALTTADMEFKTITLKSGEEVVVSYGEYQKIQQTNKNQEDRAKAFKAMYEVFNSKKNTIAGVYNAVCQRDWAQAQARNYSSTAEAALDDNAIPVSVLETLINTAKSGTEPDTPAAPGTRLSSGSRDLTLLIAAGAAADYRITTINQFGSGGPAHLYRLVLREARPDFELLAVAERSHYELTQAYPAAPLLRSVCLSSPRASSSTAIRSLDLSNAWQLAAGCLRWGRCMSQRAFRSEA